MSVANRFSMAFSAFTVLAAGCSHYQPPTAPTTAAVVADMSTPATPTAPTVPTPAAPAAPETATYTVAIDSTWSAATHPSDFPADAHFSPVVGGTHSDAVQFWHEGALASDGIQAMAERGVKSRLEDEVRTAISAGTAQFVISGGGIGRSPGSLSLDVSVSQRFSLVTLVTMVAPSPDWFMGVSALPLFDKGTWIDEVRVDLYAMDAGTDSGATFRSPDQETLPHVPLFRLTGFPFTYLGRVAPLGTMTFRRQR